jgi:hypothetical protein
MTKKFNNIKARATSTSKARVMNEEQELGNSGPTYDHSLNPNLSNVRLERVGRCWKGGKSVIRIWNSLDEENPQELLRGRVGPEQGALGGMQMYGPCATADWIGITKDLIPNCKSKQASFIVHRQTPSTRSLKWRKDTYAVKKEEVPFWDLPYPSFFDACRNANDAGEFATGGAWNAKWNKLIGGNQAAISVMKNKYYVVGHIYELGSDMTTAELVYRNKEGDETRIDRNGIPYGLDADDKLQVIWLSGDTGAKILRLCKTMKENYDGDVQRNPALPYVYGDPCGVPQNDGSVKGGLLWTVFNPKVWQPSDKAHSTWSGVIPGEKEITGYEVKVSTAYQSASGDKYSSHMDETDADKTRERSVFGWKQDGDEDDAYLLNEVSVEQEATLVAEAFADVPDLLKFAWMSHPEYFSFSGVSRVVNNRTSVGINTPPPAAPAAAAPAPVAESFNPFPTVDESSQVTAKLAAPEVASEDDCPFDETPEGTVFSGGEIEAELSSDDDNDFDDIASSFSEEEEESVSEDFDPEGDDFTGSSSEAAPVKEKAESTARTSPRRKLNRRNS